MLNRILFISLASSILLSNGSIMAAVPINSVNDGQIIKGGTYSNTVDGLTTFKNSAGTGLWLKSGNTVRGVEVNASGNQTNNGGSIFLNAPGQVVRLDGNINVNAALNSGNTAYLGNGGKVAVNAAYLYQTGNVFANGTNGGLVQYNVGAATLTGNAQIQATGLGGQGGVIAINASGPVDLGQQTVIDSAGEVAGTVDSNVINIEGSLLNLDGLLTANGSGNSRGGTVRLVSSGQTDLHQTGFMIQSGQRAGVFTTNESNSLVNQLFTLQAQHDGDIVVAANETELKSTINAKGGNSLFGTQTNTGNDPSNPKLRGGDGGTILLSAARDVQNNGYIFANGGLGSGHDPATETASGGDGGTISINARAAISNTGRIDADGGPGVVGTTGSDGGKGGLIAFGYKDTMQNTGIITANGGVAGFYGQQSVPGVRGAGGLIVFGGASNPSGNGQVIAQPGFFGGGAPLLGSIIAPDPASSSNTLIGIWRKTTGLELLSHAENLIFLRSSLPVAHNPNDFFNSWVNTATVRTVSNPGDIGTSGVAWDEVDQKTVKSGSLTQPEYAYRNLVFTNTTDKRVFFDGSFQAKSGQTSPTPLNTMTLLSNGPIIFGKTTGLPGSVIFGNGAGGGRFSSISSSFTPYVQNSISLNGGQLGGSFNIAADNLITLNGTLSQGGGPMGGSAIVQSGGYLSLSTDTTSLLSNGNLVGGSQLLIAKTTFANHGLTEANGGIFGGTVHVQGLDKLYNGPHHIQANGGQYGGGITLLSVTTIDNHGTIEAKGSSEDGFVNIEIAP